MSDSYSKISSFKNCFKQFLGDSWQIESREDNAYNEILFYFELPIKITRYDIAKDAYGAQKLVLERLIDGIHELPAFKQLNDEMAAAKKKYEEEISKLKNKIEEIKPYIAYYNLAFKLANGHEPKPSATEKEGGGE